MPAKHLLAVTTQTEAVVDHRLKNLIRNDPPGNLTVLSARDLNDRSREAGLPLLDVLDRWCTEHQDADFDMVWSNIWHLEIAALLLWAKEQLGCRIVVDQDDLPDLPDHHPGKGHEYALRGEAQQALISVADCVVNSTPFLQQVNGGIVAPNFADPENWECLDTPLPLGRFTHRIVCPISASRVLEWEDLMGEPFERLQKDFPDVQWIFAGGWPLQADESLSGQVCRISWVPNHLYKRLMQWLQPSVILSPLHDEDFNRAKSNLKYLEAGLTGAAFVGSPVGELLRTVEHRETGLITDDLEGALRELLTDPALHDRLRKAAKVDVLSNWTWPAVKDQWQEVWTWRSPSPAAL